MPKQTGRLTPRTADDKRARILESATRLFSRYGFKRTSIDLLAAEASVAKPTIYAHFADKEAIFRAVVGHVMDGILRAAETAARQEAPIAERLAEMLSAKLTRIWELLDASPHVAELTDSHGRLGADLVRRADAAFLRLLTHTVARSELQPARVRLTAATAAALLLRAASGAAYDARSAASHRKHVYDVVRVVVAAMTSEPAGHRARRRPT